MKKLLALSLVLVLMASCMAGCGNEVTSGGSVTLTMGLPNGGDITAIEIIDNFKEAHPEVELVIDETPWTDFKQKVQIQIASGTAPTLFITDSGYTATLGANEMVLDLNEKVNNELNVSEYSGGLFAGDDGEGHLWGVPHGMNTLAVFYNQDIFDKEGIAYPTEDWTFEELYDIAKKLTKDFDGDGETDQYGMMSGTNITTGWLPLILAAGGAPLDETRTKSNFDDPKTIDGLKKYVEKVWDGFEPGAEWSAAQGGAAAFYMGKVGMYIGLHSMIPVIEKNKKEDFRYDAQILPYGWDGERHCVYVPNMWVINAKASEAEQEAAWTFLKYYLGDEAQTIMTEKGLDGIQTKLTALEKLENMETSPANMKAFYSGLNDSGVTLYENATWGKWVDEVTDIANKMLNKLIGFDEGVEQMHTSVSKILNGEY